MADPTTQPLSGTVALTTGASSGIGEATAEALVDESAWREAVARTRSSEGAPGVLVNSAGLMLLGPMVSRHPGPVPHDVDQRPRSHVHDPCRDRRDDGAGIRPYRQHLQRRRASGPFRGRCAGRPSTTILVRPTDQTQP